MSTLGLELRRKVLQSHLEGLELRLIQTIHRSVRSVRSDLVTYYIDSADSDVVSFHAEHWEHGLTREYTVSVSDGTPDDDVEYEKYSASGEWVDGGYCQYRRLQKSLRAWIEAIVKLNAEIEKAEAELSEIDEAIAYQEIMSEEEDHEEEEREERAEEVEAPKVQCRRSLREGAEHVTILWKGKTATVKYLIAANLYTAIASTYLQYTQAEIDTLVDMLNSWQYIE